ncbi:unnamed protein product [Trichobilharzia regenti]|uniref:Mitochondrial import inner membrane translocase subunit n=1 Tax=Trichobilharzia regenti TaxID=157069 RepID=A0A183WAM6_TRIRE|nr:unnamed protein product [Trichobilharzia regenti]VDQ05059.1 unnamed protein product [Trichobilharzia regenti]
MLSSSKSDKAVERQMQIFEIEMMQQVFTSMTNSCLAKCIPTNYTDGDLTKGEAVCLDRCASKFMQAYMQATKKLSTMASPDTKSITDK